MRVQVEGPPFLMQWGPNPRLMCVVCERPTLPDHTAVNVCRKTLLKQCFRDGYVVIQVGDLGLMGPRGRAVAQAVVAPMV